MSLDDLSNGASESLPLVSIVLPVNRDDGYLTEAINSILTQTLKDFELIVVANNCTDELWEQLTAKAKQDIRIRPFRSPLGQLPYNLNLGLHHARAEYVARMDADDIATAQRLEKQLDFLRTNCDISVVGSRYEHIDELGNQIGYPSTLFLSSEKIDARLPFETCLPHPTVMMRRSHVLRVGGYAYGLYAEDWDLWLRMRRAGMKFRNLPDILLQYRIHKGQSTSMHSFKRNMANVQALLLRELILSGSLVFLISMLRHFGVEMFRQILSFVRKVFFVRRYYA